MAITRKKTDLGDLRPRSNPTSPNRGSPNRPAAHSFVWLLFIWLLLAVVEEEPLVVTVTVTVPLCSVLAAAIVVGSKLHEMESVEGGTPGG